jgi:hypothetical protein
MLQICACILVFLASPVLCWMDRYGEPCLAAAGKYNFGCEEVTATQPCLCDIDAYLATVIGCIVLNAPDQLSKKDAYKRITKVCPTFARNFSDYEDLVSDLKDDIPEEDLETEIQTEGFVMPQAVLKYNFRVRRLKVLDIRKGYKYG